MSDMFFLLQYIRKIGMKDAEDEMVAWDIEFLSQERQKLKIQHEKIIADVKEMQRLQPIYNTKRKLCDRAVTAVEAALTQPSVQLENLEDSLDKLQACKADIEEFENLARKMKIICNDFDDSVVAGLIQRHRALWAIRKAKTEELFQNAEELVILARTGKRFPFYVTLCKTYTCFDQY